MSSSVPRPRALVLGPVVVEGRHGALVAPSSARARALVVALVLAQGRTVSASALITDLWPDEQPADPRAALQSLVSRTRAVLAEGALVSAPGGYVLLTESDLDVARERTREAAVALAAGDALGAVASARAALDLWRGEPGDDLLDLVGSPVGEDLVATAERRRAEAEQALLDALLAAGDHQDAVGWAERAVERAPLDEDAHLALLRAYVGAGRSADALRTFGALRTRLADELGADPRADLVALNTGILQGTATTTATAPVAAGSGSTDGTAALAPSSRPPRRGTVLGLRAAPNALVGREADVVTILGLLARSRLVTVLGPGGMGKTRAVQEVARRAGATTPLVAVVELASVRTGQDIGLALTSALEIRDTRGLRLGDQVARTEVHELVADRLGETETLLVLDNCEHVVDEAAAWAAELLAVAPGLTILTTSRSPLQVGGEQVHPLEPLATTGVVGGGAGPAVELFRARALAARPGTDLPDDVVERLCAHLDGLPLAIELAAARVRTLSVQEIERRLDARFALLTTGDRSAPARHRTLHAVIDWSWNLLTAPQQELLRRLSLLPDGFGVQTAQAASAVGLDDVEALVNQSLLTVTDEPLCRTARYRMLETVREFGALALDEAGERETAQEATYRWAVDLARREVARLEGTRQVPAMLALRVEQENLLHVLRTALAADRADVVLPVFHALGLHWSLRGAHTEVVGLGRDVLRVVAGWQGRLVRGIPDVPVEQLTREAGIVLFLLTASTPNGDPATGVRAAARLRRLHRDADIGSRAAALTDLLADAGDPLGMGPRLAELHTSDDPFVALVAHLLSAQLSENNGRLDEAIAQVTVAHGFATRTQDTWGAATSALFLAQLASEQGDAARALEWVDTAREGLGRLHADEDLRQLDWLEATNLALVGRVAEAEPLFTSLVETDDDPVPSGIGGTAHELRSIGHAGLAEIAVARGDHARALAELEAANAAVGSGAARRSPWYTMFAAGWLSTLLLPAPGTTGPWEPDALPSAQAERLARELRVRMIAGHRAAPGMVDYPVLGTAALALGAYLWASPGLDRVDDGLTLLELARRMGARQDVPSLRTPAHVAWARTLHGDAHVDEVRDAVGQLGHDDLPDRVIKILRTAPWTRPTA
ncbi:AfsR/SARP family transcriptional regulator [Oerskovia paurometabola]|uniref:BTAD domain-containing putative transcriptional regulator n=1 Tax=Oerskovia paurometabola TaxID=162170 RepID=A0ABW1XAY9_9CELL|nr:BTAD domain-containing putative transcriptional regulator [Oerskovia paurometabola]MBM7497145.1 putative ATPase [Oerskovia paurometabola]